jgi:glycosyltransferase involved in cell wall biosynthesis
MSTPAPLFTIVIPTYNRAHLIGKTIQSILEQDFTNFEVLIVDDGSKDNTEGVIARFTDLRIQYYKKQNAERGAARNFGAARALGKYINFFDSDDLMYTNHLLAASTLIEKENLPEFFHLGYDYKLEDGTLLKEINDFTDGTKEEIFFDNKLSCNGVFIRKDIATEFPFEENRVLASSEDWALWIKLLCRFKFVYSNEITSSVINHDQRSLRTIPAEKVAPRDIFFIELMKQDAVVTKNYGRGFYRFIAERYTFFMLAYAEQGKKSEVLRWAYRAFMVYPLILTSKRFLASIKNVILK